MPKPIYPEYIPLEDEHEFPAEEQPLPPIDSPTAESPGYVTESDPEEDPRSTRMRDRSWRGEHLAPTDSAIVVPVDDCFPHRGNKPVYHHPPLTLLLGLGLPSGLRLPYLSPVGKALIDAVTTALPSTPLPPLPPSLYIPPPVDRRDDILRKTLYLSTLGSRVRFI
ncbi:hypothetical protein Tco_0333373 [Tanacetum coccineum]